MTISNFFGFFPTQKPRENFPPSPFSSYILKYFNSDFLGYFLRKMSFRIKELYKRRRKESNTSIFDRDNLTPKCEEELAIHHKKLEELKQWFRTKMGVCRGAKTLLLTGPSGSGKRTAIKIICADLGIEVTEWDWTDEYSLDGRGETITRRSSLSSFVQFLGDTEFCSIQRMSLKHRLLLIGQLPSSLIREPKYLHEILLNVVPHSRCLILFILPNVDSCWELSPFRLFPPSIVDSLGIDHIKFNPISTTLMVSALKRFSRKLHPDSLVNSEQITEIVNSSFGDIRRAMTTLLLRMQCAKSTENGQRVAKKARLGRHRPSASSAPTRTQRMATTQNQLDLFHFIGKVMYAKRAEKADDKWLELESRLSSLAIPRHSRPFPPKDDLNWLIDTAPISAQMLAGYVFEHEPRFSPTIQTTAQIGAMLAQLDVMVTGSSIERRNTVEKYMLDLTIRSSLFYNYRHDSAMPKQRFYQFEKPKMREFDARRNETKFQIAQLYPIDRSAQMATLLLPAISRIYYISVNRSQLGLLERLCLPSRPIFPPRLAVDNTARQPSKPIDPEIHTQTALFDDDEAPSPDASLGSFYSISSHLTDQDQEDDGFNYDIEETEDV